MKKMLDRRMVGFFISSLAIYCLADKHMSDPSMALNMIVGLYGILVGGNVVQAIKEPKA